MKYVELTEEMEMPCLCENCGDWFDLNDGNPCEDKQVNIIFCRSCVPKPWGKLKRGKFRRKKAYEVRK